MKKPASLYHRYARSGQALVEYALILVMIAILFGVTLAATGPAIGNVFSNVIYNIIGGEPSEVERLAEDRGSHDSFWATVEWLRLNPPAEQAFGMNTPLPPPATPTEGPSPTPSPITPSPLPSNTPTATATGTLTDRGHTAPWLDTINNPEWWRVDSNSWLGSDQFLGQYFANATLSGTPAETLWHQKVLGDNPGTVDWGGIDFNWPSGTGPIENFTNTNYSIRWTRQIGYGFPTPPNSPVTATPKQVQFTLSKGAGQSGARVWLYELASATTPMTGCSSVPSGGASGSTSAVYTDGQSPTGSPTDCLLINTWRDNTETLTVTRTLQPNRLYVLQVDFYKKTGDANIRLQIDGLTSGNPDDASLISGNAPQCSWYRADTLRSNSKVFIWEEARIGEFPQNQVCYLELRGWIDYTLVNNPKLIFWDVWDMTNANTQVWLEVAEYKPNRADLNWTQIPLRSGTTNYAWTRNIIDLASYVSGYSQKRLALRFAMRDNNGGARRRWYVDDIEIRNFGTKTFGVCTGSKDTCASYWPMDDAEVTLGNAVRNIDPQFVTSGRWALTTTNAQGQFAMGIDTALRVNEVDGGNRIHFVEFNGLIDVTGNVPDYDGDDGVAVLTFSQAYTVARGTQLELQWTRDVPDKEPDNWQTLTVLVPEHSSSTPVTQGMLERTVLLDGIPNWNTQPFRLRFAQIVKPTATESGGWWIDNILLHRFDKPRFSNYPFYDPAEGGMDYWLPEGQWGITNSTNFTLGLPEGSGRAFTDSPQGDYMQGTGRVTSLILRRPIDLNFDTPENLDPTDDSNVQTAAAVNPVLSFWHWRDMRTSHGFYVDWSNNGGTSWNTIWRYVPASVSITSSHRQRAWEYVEIHLRDIQAAVATNPATPYDDDILIRFRLDATSTSGSGNRDGIYLDDIRIQNFSEVSHKLWDPSRVHATHGAGTNIRYADDFDSPVDYWNRWKLGPFVGVDNTQHSGLIALHESPVNSSGGTVITTQYTYNVLQMDTIIDMRAVTTNDNPTMYFWTRYHLGDTSNIQVQIAAENTAYTPTNGAGVTTTFDYERVRGWGTWDKRWERTADARVQTWFRAAIDLKPYAGQRIKVRFVYNALQGSRQDGWYIDDVIFELRSTVPIPLPFNDTAKSLGNWIVEGSWGLAPDQWRGSGGGPADIGNDFWTGVYYDCERYRSGSRCSQASHYNNILYTDYNNKIKRGYNPALDIQEFALEIDHDFGTNGRPIGGQDDSTWFDYYMARWERPITITAPSDITFITVSDDGVRLRRAGPGISTSTNNATWWNIIEQWNDHGRRVDIATVSFNPGVYNLTLEWYEATSTATIIASAGTNNFSFSDSPKAGNGPSFPVINSTQYGNSSLILKSPIDLTGSTLPVIEYWTRYRLGGGTARFEVSTNGGFDWTTSNLNSTTGGFVCPNTPGAYSGLNNASPPVSCAPSYTGTFWPVSTTNGEDDLTVWQRRQHNLTSYRANGLINIRFNLQTAGSVNDGWYVTDITISP